MLYVVPQGKKTIALTIKVAVKPYSFKEELAKAATNRARRRPRSPGPHRDGQPQQPRPEEGGGRTEGHEQPGDGPKHPGVDEEEHRVQVAEDSIIELDFKSVDEIVERGHAECRGYTILFTALCRAADVPARPIWGLACVYGRRIANGQHRQPQLGGGLRLRFRLGAGRSAETRDARSTADQLYPRLHGREEEQTSTETLPMLNLLFMVGDGSSSRSRVDIPPRQPLSQRGEG